LGLREGKGAEKLASPAETRFSAGFEEEEKPIYTWISTGSVDESGT